MTETPHSVYITTPGEGDRSPWCPRGTSGVRRHSGQISPGQLEVTVRWWWLRHPGIHCGKAGSTEGCLVHSGCSGYWDLSSGEGPEGECGVSLQGFGREPVRHQQISQVWSGCHAKDTALWVLMLFALFSLPTVVCTKLQCVHIIQNK